MKFYYENVKSWFTWLRGQLSSACLGLYVFRLESDLSGICPCLLRSSQQHCDTAMGGTPQVQLERAAGVPKWLGEMGRLHRGSCAGAASCTRLRHVREGIPAAGGTEAEAMGHERAWRLPKMKGCGFSTVHITHGSLWPLHRGLGKGLPSADFQNEIRTSFSCWDSEALDCPPPLWPSPCLLGSLGSSLVFLECEHHVVKEWWEKKQEC